MPARGYYDSSHTWFAWQQPNPFSPYHWRHVVRPTAARLHCEGVPLFFGTMAESRRQEPPPNFRAILFARSIECWGLDLPRLAESDSRYARPRPR
jgi:hypothetical protein